MPPGTFGGACGRFDGGRDRHVKRGSRLMGAHATSPRWGLNNQSNIGWPACAGGVAGRRALTTPLKPAISYRRRGARPVNWAGHVRRGDKLIWSLRLERLNLGSLDRSSTSTPDNGPSNRYRLCLCARTWGVYAADATKTWLHVHSAASSELLGTWSAHRRGPS